MKVGNVICVLDFRDLCLRHVCDFVGNLSRTLSQVSVMEFGLNSVKDAVLLLAIYRVYFVFVCRYCTEKPVAIDFKTFDE